MTPDELRQIADQLHTEAEQLEMAAAHLEKSLRIIAARPNPDKTAENILETNMSQVVSRVIPWGKQAAALDPEFINGLRWIWDEIKLSPSNLVPCMKFESDLNPKARNKQSSASGLIQFMEYTAPKLGTTIQAIREMNALEQLGYVYKYFKQFGTDLSRWTLCDTYLAILWPAGIGKPHDAPIFVRGSAQYRVNAGLDTNRDGNVTKTEICRRLEEVRAKGLGENSLIVDW